MDMLAEAIDFEYDTDSIEKEKGVGKYSADIVLKESYTNKTILIENQYGKTDHRHLGEIITYASGLSESEQAGVSRVI
ncbi:hypothetical protein FACS1894166_02870 [Bacilli bacterium]|nr:hypothetical protein FACS1894166_02870 [Bacilli bacterium]